MTDDRQRRRWLLLAAWALVPALLAGCTRGGARLEVTSYKDPYFPETYVVELAECTYYVDTGGDYHIVGRAVRAPEEGTEGAITQLLHVHLFWRPRPGKTFDNPSTVDATLRYAIATGSGVAVYSGTGFVYLKKRRLSDDVVARVEEAQLRLDSQAGAGPELLGPARLAGTLAAKRNASLAVDLRRQLDLYAGPGGSD